MKNKSEEKGKRRLVWLSEELDILVDDTREKFGMSRSSFIRNAIMRYLEGISVISEKAHKLEALPLEEQMRRLDKMIEDIKKQITQAKEKGDKAQ